MAISLKGGGLAWGVETETEIENNLSRGAADGEDWLSTGLVLLVPYEGVDYGSLKVVPLLYGVVGCDSVKVCMSVLVQGYGCDYTNEV